MLHLETINYIITFKVLEVTEYEKILDIIVHK